MYEIASPLISTSVLPTASDYQQMKTPPSDSSIKLSSFKWSRAAIRCSVPCVCNIIDACMGLKAAAQSPTGWRHLGSQHRWQHCTSIENLDRWQHYTSIENLDRWQHCSGRYCRYCQLRCNSILFSAIYCRCDASFWVYSKYLLSMFKPSRKRSKFMHYFQQWRLTTYAHKVHLKTNYIR